MPPFERVLCSSLRSIRFSSRSVQFHLKINFRLVWTPSSNDSSLRTSLKFFPICRNCHRLFQPSIPRDAVCPDCEEHLFRVVSNTLFHRITVRSAPLAPAHCLAPMQVLSSLLVNFLSLPGFENIVDKYPKTRTSIPGRMTDTFDGRICQEAKCPDGSPFFDPNDMSGELRIGVTMSLDW